MMPMASPQPNAASSPIPTRASLPFITVMDTALASPILAGSDRSTFPGPSVMTIIWPSPTTTVNTARASAVVIMPPAPGPAGEPDGQQKDKAAPRNDQIHGLDRSAARLFMCGRLAPDLGARRQHDDQNDRRWRRPASPAGY